METGKIEDRLLSENKILMAIQKALIKMGYEPLGNEVQEIFKVIDELPTAYDVEKVVSELRPLSFRLPKDYCGLDGKDRVVMFDDAIDIVKKGGVE